MTKKAYLAFALFLVTFSAFGQNAWRSKVAPELLAAFDRGETADFFLVFREKADLGNPRSGETKSERAHRVFAALQLTAERSQASARRLLREQGVRANSLFLVNAIAVQGGSAALARTLASLPEVLSLAADPWVQFDGPVNDVSSFRQFVIPSSHHGVATNDPMTNDEDMTRPRSGTEWGLEKINAPAVWSLGYTGQGITVGGADTGYEWLHPAIKPHYRGWDATGGTAEHNYNWHDAIHTASPLNSDTLNPCGFSTRTPCDDNNHGTHTMGTMTGDDGQGNQIGVAPGAKWVACRNMERGWGKPSSYIECFQWFLAPTDLDGKNPDPDKAPHVINNSWYCSFEEGCTDLTVNELMRQAVIAVKASGVFVVVSNGNFGPNCATTYGPPAYFEESFSVGSTRLNDTISGFSSRGPVLADSSFRIKPNVAAPGSQVRSCIRNGEYANFSGTSMAGPHVAGLVALVLSARPDLAGNVEFLETLIEQTAVPFNDTIQCGDVPGDARPNQAYGWGRVDALAAVQAALAVPAAEPDGAGPQVQVSPNPVRDDAVFSLTQLSGKVSLTVLNTAGQVVFTQHWNASSGSEQVRFSMKNLPYGAYFYHLRSENGSAAGKMIRG